MQNDIQQNNTQHYDYNAERHSSEQFIYCDSKQHNKYTVLLNYVWCRSVKCRSSIFEVKQLQTHFDRKK